MELRLPRQVPTGGRQTLTMPSPMLWTTQGTRAVLPVCAVITLELSVRKRGGRDGGKEASSSFMLDPASVVLSGSFPTNTETHRRDESYISWQPKSSTVRFSGLYHLVIVRNYTTFWEDKYSSVFK